MNRLFAAHGPRLLKRRGLISLSDMSHPEFWGEGEQAKRNLLSYYRGEQTDSARRFL